jgi:hypothetical protein
MSNAGKASERGQEGSVEFAACKEKSVKPANAMKHEDLYLVGYNAVFS